MLQHLSLSFLFFNETDVTAALDAGDADFPYVLGLSFESEVFFEVVLGNQAAPQCFLIHSAVLHNDNRRSLHEVTEEVRIVGGEGAGAMNEHKCDARSNGAKERRGAVDRT